MGKKKIIQKLPIEQIAPEGKGIARYNGKAIFVENTVPGDLVDAKITRNRSDYSLARAVHFHQYSSDRAKAFCSHFGVCGGCKWQDIAYDKQLEYKETIVKDAFARIGKQDVHKILPIVGNDHIKYYRNKLEYTFSNRRWLTDEEVKSGSDFPDRSALGFHIPGAFDKIVDIQECFLQEDMSNQIRSAIRSFAIDKKYQFFNLLTQEGLLRNVIIRNNLKDEYMITIIFFEHNQSKIETLLKYIEQKFSQITSLNYVINPKKNDTIYDLEVINFSGVPYLIETLGEIQYKIGPKSFFQTNTPQAKNLYNLVVEMAKLKSTDIVYDLYTGIGSIALYVAKSCQKVIGVEQIEAAIDDAKENARLNNIANASFYAAAVEKILDDDFIQKEGNPDVVITDPPRAGMHKDVVEMLLRSNTNRIVYVSCNPATQARDIQLLSEQYQLIKAIPVDMFPHTYHVECIAVLERR